MVAGLKQFLYVCVCGGVGGGGGSVCKGRGRKKDGGREEGS